MTKCKISATTFEVPTTKWAKSRVRHFLVILLLFLKPLQGASTDVVPEHVFCLESTLKL